LGKFCGRSSRRLQEPRVGEEPPAELDALEFAENGPLQALSKAVHASRGWVRMCRTPR